MLRDWDSAVACQSQRASKIAVSPGTSANLDVVTPFVTVTKLRFRLRLSPFYVFSSCVPITTLSKPSSIA